MIYMMCKTFSFKLRGNASKLWKFSQMKVFVERIVLIKEVYQVRIVVFGNYCPLVNH